MTGPAPLSEKAAKELDTQIRAYRRLMDAHMDLLYPLLEEAEKRGIHAALGLPTWAAYVKVALPTFRDPEVREQRKRLVALMTGRRLRTTTERTSLK
jgi:hypothetical protein